MDGIVLRRFKKTVILYQNLIPFTYTEFLNYGISRQTLKIFITYTLYKYSKFKSDGIILLNHYCKKIIENKINKIKNYKIIPHGIDRSFFINKFKKNVNKKYFDIVYVSPIDLYKHQWNVIEACERLNYKVKNIRLHLIGSISNQISEKLLNEKLSQINSLNVNIYGKLRESKIKKILANSDLFLFASSCESFGLTLLEGMASDLPVLCSNKSGMKKLTENKANYFDPHSIRKIESSIQKIYPLKK